MSSDDQTVGQQQPPERPEPSSDAIEAERDAAHDPLVKITTEPGDRKTDSVSMLVVEAELACLEGKKLDNPAKPRTENVGESFREEIDNHEDDLVPAWTRPWEDGE